MLIEYYSIRMKDAEPGKGSLHVTSHYDEVRSSLKHFKEKHPDKKIVAYKHELKKGPMGMSHKRKVMFGESRMYDKENPVWHETFSDKDHDNMADKTNRWSKDNIDHAGHTGIMIDTFIHPKTKQLAGLSRYRDKDTHDVKDYVVHSSGKVEGPFPKGKLAKVKVTEMFANRGSGSSDKENKAWEKKYNDHRASFAMPWHRVAVTVSNPGHAAVSKRTEQVQRFIKVRAKNAAAAKTRARAHYKNQGYKVHEVEYHSQLEQTNESWGGEGVHMGAHVVHRAGGTGKVVAIHNDQEATVKDEYGNSNRVMISDLKPSFFSKMKSAHKQVSEGTKSFKTLMRSIEDKKSIKNLKVPSPTERKEMDKPKPEPVKESVTPMMGKTVHSVTQGEDTYTVHDTGNVRSSSRFKVRKNNQLLSNHASSGNAHAWLKTHIDSQKD